MLHVSYMTITNIVYEHLTRMFQCHETFYKIAIKSKINCFFLNDTNIVYKFTSVNCIPTIEVTREVIFSFLDGAAASVLQRYWNR